VSQDKIIEIICSVDDFCQGCESELKKHQLSDGTRKRNRILTMSDSEVISIAILFTFLDVGSLNISILVMSVNICKLIFPRRCLITDLLNSCKRHYFPWSCILKWGEMLHVLVFPSLIPPPFEYATTDGSTIIKCSRELQNEDIVALDGSLVSNFIV